MKRSPAAAFWLSLLPGLGHLYLGQVKKGVTFALIAVAVIYLTSEAAGAFGILIPILWLFGMLDAHRSAQAINLGLEGGDQVMETFDTSGSKWWGGVLIGLGILLLLFNLDVIDLDWLWRFWPVVFIGAGIWLLKPGPAKSASAPAPPLPTEPESAPTVGPSELGDDDASHTEEEAPETTEEGETDDRAEAS
jgi:hypothetical protein